MKKQNITVCLTCVLLIVFACTSALSATFRATPGVRISFAVKKLIPLQNNQPFNINKLETLIKELKDNDLANAISTHKLDFDLYEDTFKMLWDKCLSQKPQKIKTIEILLSFVRTSDFKNYIDTANKELNYGSPNSHQKAEMFYLKAVSYSFEMSEEQKNGLSNFCLNLAERYKVEGNADKATEYFEKALVYIPNCEKADLELAKLYYDGTKYLKAVQHCEKLPEGSRGVVGEILKISYLRLATMSESSNQTDQAINYLEKVLVYVPDCREAHLNLAGLYYTKRRYLESSEQCRAVLNNASSTEEANTSKEILKKSYLTYKEGKSTPEVIACLLDIIKYIPDCKEAHMELARIYFEDKNYSEAEEHCAKVIINDNDEMRIQATNILASIHSIRNPQIKHIILNSVSNVGLDPLLRWNIKIFLDGQNLQTWRNVSLENMGTRDIGTFTNSQERKLLITATNGGQEPQLVGEATMSREMSGITEVGVEAPGGQKRLVFNFIVENAR